MTRMPETPPRMTISRLQIVARGLTNRCPNCGGRTLFTPGTFFQINAKCSRCGLVIERDEGSFLGAMSLNYGVTLVCFLTPVLLLTYGQVIGTTTGIVLASIEAVAMPALLYRPSRSWWLMNYYFFLPRHLPAHRPEVKPADDANA